MPAMEPTCTNKDVTVVVATLGGEGEAFLNSINSILATHPAKVIIVAPHLYVDRLKSTFETYSTVSVIGCRYANKRLQMTVGLAKVETSITAFADDDVIWPPSFLFYLLAAFEDPSTGATGPSQRLVRVSHPNIWNILGAAYLERRNFEIRATQQLDGGISTLSGRTCACRTHIIQNGSFMRAFLGEKWMGTVPLWTGDDDKFLTRWLVSHGWRIRVQSCKEAQILTTLEDSPVFLSQCVRWYRTKVRSNMTSMFVDRVVWT